MTFINIPGRSISDTKGQFDVINTMLFIFCFTLDIAKNREKNSSRHER